MLLIKNKGLRMICGAIETFNLLTLKLWWKNPSRARAFSGKIFRDYMSLVGRDRWTSRSISEILPNAKDSRIVLEHLPGDGIFNPIDELAYLALITRYLEPKKVFEIGTFRGRTALNFALNSPADCIVFTMDLPLDDRESLSNRVNAADAAIIKASETGLYYRGRPEAGKIKQLYGDSLVFDFKPYAASVDLVFVDGAHDYRCASSDTRNAFEMVVEGGFIVWHDFSNYGDYNDVTRAVLDLIPSGKVIQIENSQLAVYRKEAGDRLRSH